MNILVSGGTGSGKTTTLNVIARFIPHNQRVITIEDAAELQIDHPHVISLEHRPPNVEGKGELTIRQLLRNSLRMRPDRILVGEVRGSEALDMLQAMNTGHDGSMSTIHSNSARDALSRLETMVMMASIDIPFEAVRAQIASAVNLIVHQARMPDGRRKIAQIAEVVGYDQNGAVLRDIFLLGMGGDLRLEYNATGYVPTSLDKAAFYGVQVDKDLFDPVKARFIPAGSDSMMPVVKDPLMSGQRGSENVVRQVVVVPFSSDRPGQQQQPCRRRRAAAAPAQSMASTPEMQEEMRKLIDAARSAVADLQAAAPAPQAAEPMPTYQPPPVSQPPPVYQAPTRSAAARSQARSPPCRCRESRPIAAGPVPAAPVSAHRCRRLGRGRAGAAGRHRDGPRHHRARPDGRGRPDAASSPTPACCPRSSPRPATRGLGVSRRLKAVIESIVSNKNLNLRLAPADHPGFRGRRDQGQRLRQAEPPVQGVRRARASAGHGGGTARDGQVRAGRGRVPIRAFTAARGRGRPRPAHRRVIAADRGHDHRQPLDRSDRRHRLGHVHRRRGLDQPACRRAASPSRTRS